VSLAHFFIGIICGAETISNAFAELAALRIPLDSPNREWVIDQMRRNFEKEKQTFGNSRRDRPVKRPGATRADEMIVFSL